MTPIEAVAELMEMRRTVTRKMPHVDCVPAPGSPCNCYKLSINAALLRAEMQLRTDLAMDPF